LPRSLDHSAALYLAAFILLLLANTFPFVALQYGDRIEQSLLISGGFALQQAGMGEIGLLVLLTSVVFPFLTTLSMLYLLLPLRIGVRPPQMTNGLATGTPAEPLEPDRCLHAWSACIRGEACRTWQ
jgi:uncharacterized paraquat-inducible protein A